MDNNYSTILDLDLEQNSEEKNKNENEMNDFFNSNIEVEDLGKMENASSSNNNVPLINNFGNFNNNQQSEANTTKKYSFWNIEYYSKYFNVDTKDVIDRIICTCLPKENFFNKIDSNPDLYGPIWISTTVILTLFVTSCITGSLVSYFNDDKNSDKYDFSLLSFAAVVVYTYIGLVPLALWIIFKYYSIEIGLIDLYCLYGYGLSLWIPASIFSILPFSLVHNIFVILAGLISGYYLYHNLYSYTMNSSNKIASMVVFGTVFTSLIIIVLIFKFVFLKFQIN